MNKNITLWHLNKIFSVSALLSLVILSCQNSLVGMEAGGKGGNANKDKSVNEKLPPIQHDAECPKGCSKDKCKHPRLPAREEQKKDIQPQPKAYNPPLENISGNNNPSYNPPINNISRPIDDNHGKKDELKPEDPPVYKYLIEIEEKDSTTEIRDKKFQLKSELLELEGVVSYDENFYGKLLTEYRDEDKNWKKTKDDIRKEIKDYYQKTLDDIVSRTKDLVKRIEESAEQEKIKREIKEQEDNQYLQMVRSDVQYLNSLPNFLVNDVFIESADSYFMKDIPKYLQSIDNSINKLGIKKADKFVGDSQGFALAVSKKIINNQPKLKHKYKILKLPLDKNPNHGDIPAQIAKAKELLDRLKFYKTQLFSILADHNESFQDYGFDENDYDSDPDNDYTRTELSEFINSYDVGPCTQKFQDIKEAISNQSKDIIQLLGAKEDASAYDFAGILSAKELVMQIQKRIQNHDKIEDICDDIVRAIIQNLPNPQVKAFNITNLSKIKTQFDKLRLGISFVLQDAIGAMRQENAAQDMLSKKQNEDKKPQKKELDDKNKQSNNIINTDKPTIEESKSNHGNNTESKSESEEDKPNNTDKFYDNLYGIDVSHHQGEIDWDKVLKYKWNNRELKAVILKATEEIVPKKDKKDKWFKTNWQAVRNAGLKIKGAYHFFHAEGDSCPIKQANRFISLLKSPEIGFDLKNDFYVIDVESIYVKSKTNPKIKVEVKNYPPKKEFADKILKFYELMEEKKFKNGMIYTRTEFWNLRIDEAGRKIWDKGIKLWLAGYGKDNNGDIPEDKYYPTELPIGSDFPVMLQFTDKGSVNVIDGNVDLNLIKIGFGK